MCYKITGESDFADAAVKPGKPVNERRQETGTLAGIDELMVAGDSRN